MFVAPIRPEDLKTLSDERKRKINELLAKRYHPSVGFVEFTCSAFSEIIDISSLSPGFKVVLDDIRKEYGSAGWRVTCIEKENQGWVATIIRFEDAKKFSKN